MKWIDIPPAWLLVFAFAAWSLGRIDPWGLTFGTTVAQLLAGIFIGAGLILMALAFVEMRKWRTTVIPHREATHLVQSGIFKRTRNPIYLGDSFILLGLILRFDAPLALPLLPVFVWWIERHFIIPEERRLEKTFRVAFASYCAKTRRWL